MNRRDGLLGEHARQVGGVAVTIRGGNDHGSALGERPVQLPHVHVKGDGGLVQNAVALPHRNLVLLPAQAVINRAVADGNALRPARGAGGEEHVSVLVQAGFRARKLLCGGCRGECPGGLVSAQQRQSVLGQVRVTRRLLRVQLLRTQRVQAGAVQKQGALGVLHHHAHTLSGQIRKHRHIGGASVQQGVQRHVLLGAAVHTQTHRVGRANTPVQQLRGKRTGALIQLGVGEGAVKSVGALRLGGEHLTGRGGRIQHGERLRMRRHRITEATQQGLILHRVLGKRRGGQLAQGRKLRLGRQAEVVQGGALALRLRGVGG